jgi:phage terminase large subunit
VEGAGNGPEQVTVVHGHDTMQVAGMGARYLQSRRGTIAIDVVGVGSGVYDRLKEQRLPGHVMEVQAGAGSNNDAMLNLRAELWWSLREALYRGEVSFSRLEEPIYQRLRAELTGPTYRHTSSGKVQIESKEEMKARGLASPDLADALCLWQHARSRARRRVSSFGAAA